MFRFGDPGGRMYTSVGTSQVNLLALWTTQGNNNADAIMSVSAGNGRTTGSALLFNSSNTNRYSNLTRNLDSQQTWGIAFAYKPPALSGSYLALLMDNNSLQCELKINADGSLTVTRNGTSLGSTAAGVVSANVWNHIEWKTKIDPSTGTTQVWVNGVSKLSLTSQNTRATANSTANQVQIGLGNSITACGVTGNIYFDDIIVYDGQTTDPQGNADITGPIGDCGLCWIQPTGAGTTTQFTPDTGSNYARVNEATPDGDSSYVESSTVGNIDTYAMADLPASASSVKSIAVVHYARKQDAGSRSLAAEIRTGGTNYVNSTSYSLTNSYQYWMSSWGTNPNTLAAWTVSDINGIESGQNITA